MDPDQLKKPVLPLLLFALTVTLYYAIIEYTDLWYLWFRFGPIHRILIAIYALIIGSVAIHRLLFQRSITFAKATVGALSLSLLLLPFPAYVWMYPELWHPTDPGFWERAIYATLQSTLPTILMFPLGTANTTREQKIITSLLGLMFIAALLTRHVTGLWHGLRATDIQITINVITGYLTAIGFGALLVPIGHLSSTQSPEWSFFRAE